MKRDKKERKARTDGKGTLDQKDVRVLREPQGNRDPRDLKAKRVKEEMMAQLAKLDRKERKDCVV